MLSYTGIGVFCAVLNNAIVISADFASINYLAATILALALVTPLGYALHSVFTFRGPLSSQAFICFAAGTFVGSLLSIGLMVVLCSWLFMRASIAMPLATLILSVWNFLNARWAILHRGVGYPGQ